MGNSFGQLFRITTFGESHGGAVGVVIDGCPSGHRLDLEQVQQALNRRRPGLSPLTSPRSEPDHVECLSGLDQGLTLGTPLTLLVRNQDAQPDAYRDLATTYRPSHADFTTESKYGLRASSGGGRASARETIGRVAAAAVAEQVLATLLPELRCTAWVDQVADVSMDPVDPQTVTRSQVDASPIRCPDTLAAPSMIGRIEAAKADGDSVGGVIQCVVVGVPIGLGEPVFDKLEADLAKAVMSLPACRGFEVGSGFAGTTMRGSEHNDAYVVKSADPTGQSRIGTATNRSGGIQGGISNGEAIVLRAAFKPVATIFQTQSTVNRSGETVTLTPSSGRHDPCVLPRAVPMVEAMVILTLMDHYLRQCAINASSGSARRP